MKLATSNPALSEPFRDTGDYVVVVPERPDLICGIMGPGRRSGAIKAEKIQSTFTKADTRLKIVVRALKNVSSNGTYTRDRILRPARRA
ncbi:Uncharacterized protein DBV15_01669 [Temnothorax longispinosus]|uniref:Uncharacterized protein n=1 Tax=Temnothorax longispinosus TaxID=300112 RepID=A0A4S2L6V2_9HYME|nr:Uncharacterized protein DBV15_01669 [Temnothorax longispinosus]